MFIKRKLSSCGRIISSPTLQKLNIVVGEAISLPLYFLISINFALSQTHLRKRFFLIGITIIFAHNRKYFFHCHHHLLSGFIIAHMESGSQHFKKTMKSCYAR